MDELEYNLTVDELEYNLTVEMTRGGQVLVVDAVKTCPHCGEIVGANFSVPLADIADLITKFREKITGKA